MPFFVSWFPLLFFSFLCGAALEGVLERDIKGNCEERHKPKPPISSGEKSPSVSPPQRFAQETSCGFFLRSHRTERNPSQLLDGILGVLRKIHGGSRFDVFQGRPFSPNRCLCSGCLEWLGFGMVSDHMLVSGLSPDAWVASSPSF